MHNFSCFSSKIKQYFQDKNTLITANLVIISNFDKYIWSWLSDNLDYCELNLILSESYLKIMNKTKTHNQFTHTCSYMYTYRVHLQYFIKPINFYFFPKKYRGKNCLINDWINKYYYVIQWQHCKVEAIIFNIICTQVHFIYVNIWRGFSLLNYSFKLKDFNLVCTCTCIYKC